MPASLNKFSSARRKLLSGSPGGDATFVGPEEFHGVQCELALFGSSQDGGEKLFRDSPARKRHEMFMTSLLRRSDGG